MGGQACVLYGAAEFSRDTDLAVLADAANLRRLRAAMRDLQAEVIAVPPLELRYLRRGHAVHFRCFHPEALRMRVDVMASMRGVAPFEALWRRRTVIHSPDGEAWNLLSLPDLVQAKKTQRDKDWPMIRRLVEADYLSRRGRPAASSIRFWLRELRTPELLVELAGKFPRSCRLEARRRPLLRYAAAADRASLAPALAAEEAAESQRDREYWMPLRRELERLRRRAPRRRSTRTP